MKKNLIICALVFSVLGCEISLAQENLNKDTQNKENTFISKLGERISNIKFPKLIPSNSKSNSDIIVVGAGASITEDNADIITEDASTEKKSFWDKIKKRKIETSEENIKEISDIEKKQDVLPAQDNQTALEEVENNNPEQGAKNIDNISQEKQDAIKEANDNLLGDYFSTKENSENLVEGQIQKENISQEKNTTNKIEGSIAETFILSLDDCIKQALQNNPQIRSAFSNSEIYKTKIGQAWSNYFPTFNMTNGYTRNRFLSINFPVPEQEYDFFNAMDASASQLLFDFGKTKAVADMSKSTYESTIANLDETINTVVYDVKEAYYALLHALEKQNVYKDSVNSYELQLKQAEAFYNIGTKPRIDVTMAQYNLGNAQLGYVKASNEVTLAIAQLNNAMGLPDKEAYKILDKLELTEYEYDFDMVLNKAYEARPELLSYRKKAQASEILIRSTKRAFLPNIEAVGAFQVGGGSEFTDDYGWTVGAQFVYGNTNLWLLKKQVEEAKATHQKDLADLEVMEQNVYLQVKQAFLNLKNAHESIPITALSLKHAKEQFELASGRYKAGVGDAIELKDSEITYRNARLDYLAALLQYNVSVADLERVIGAKLPKAGDVTECE